MGVNRSRKIPGMAVEGVRRIAAKSSGMVYLNKKVVLRPGPPITQWRFKGYVL